MKQLLLNILVISSLFICTAGCRKSSYSNEKNELLFQYEYINYAWGYQHSGYIIDNHGNILTYNNPESWNFSDKGLTLTEKQVNDNISMCKQSGKIIPEAEIQKYSGYIKNIASSKVTAMKNVAADAGTAEFVCYVYSESSGTYKRYLIKMEGDFTCDNLNFYSKRVVTWMKDIHTGLSLN